MSQDNISREEDLQPEIKDKETNNISKIRSETDEFEKKVWKLVKQIPGLNVGYGSIRLVIYIAKHDKEESWESAEGVATGLVQSAAIAGSFFVTSIVAPIAAGALSTVVSGSIKGVAHLIVFIIEHPDNLLKDNSSDKKEQLLYQEVKDIPAIGSVYSAARLPFYLVKGNTSEAKISAVNSVFGGATTLANCGVGILTMLDKDTQQVIQRSSKSIIQLVSKKVLEKVAAKQLTLEEGLKVVQSLENKCEQLNNAPLENIEEQSDKCCESNNSSEIQSEEKLVKVENDKHLSSTNLTEEIAQAKKRKNIFERLLKILKCQHSDKSSQGKTDIISNEKHQTNFYENPIEVISDETIIEADELQPKKSSDDTEDPAIILII